MDPKIPNAEEGKKLKKMARYYQLLPFYSFIPFIVFFLVESIFKNYPAIQIVIIILLFLVMVYLLLNFAVLKRCPRCAAWGTPVLGGNCSKCGLHLDPGANDF